MHFFLGTLRFNSEPPLRGITKKINIKVFLIVLELFLVILISRMVSFPNKFQKNLPNGLGGDAITKTFAKSMMIKYVVSTIHRTMD